MNKRTNFLLYTFDKLLYCCLTGNHVSHQRLLWGSWPTRCVCRTSSCLSSAQVYLERSGNYHTWKSINSSGFAQDDKSDPYNLQKDWLFWSWWTILCYRGLELMKQFLGKGYTRWFAIAFPAVVRAGILNVPLGPAIARLLFAKDTVESFTSTNNCWQTGHLV